MTDKPTFQINMPLSPDDFQYLYRLIFFDFDEGVPDSLAHTLYAIKEALKTPIIIELKAGPDDGEIPKEAVGNGRVLNEPSRDHAGHRPN